LVNALQQSRTSNLANISDDGFLTDKHEPARVSQGRAVILLNAFYVSALREFFMSMKPYDRPVRDA
jgi:hypothetical protein